jgi:RNA polymerase sigma factor
MNLDDSALALRAAEDERAREELILRQEKNILRIASRAKHRFVTKSDDEWSIALYAFSRAIDTYRSGRGAFLPYAETLIRRSLIDAHRAEAKFAREVSVAPASFEGESEDGAPNPVLAAVARTSVRAADTALQDEILAANEELSKFGFRFFDLTDCSPNREHTKQACLRAAEALLTQDEDVVRMKKSRQLPVRVLVQRYGMPKKLVERYRKYIIAMVVIRSGDYPALNGFIRGGWGNET